MMNRQWFIWRRLSVYCLLCGANPVDYLTELERHASQVSEQPDQWLPWNYPGHAQKTNAPLAPA